MKRLGYLLALGLVLAGIIHLVIILTIPSFAEQDAWARLSNQGGPWQFIRVATAGSEGDVLEHVDPAFSAIACRFDLNEAPLVVRANGQLPFWSASIFDRRGRNVYSFNDRTAIERALFLLVVDAVQMARLRQNPPAETEEAVIVEADIGEGFVIVRVLESDATWRERVEGFLEGAQCGRYELPTVEDIADPAAAEPAAPGS